MSSNALDASREVEQSSCFRILCIERLDLVDLLQRFIERCKRRNHFCYAIAVSIAESHDGTTTAHGSARCHSAEGDDLRDAILSIFLLDVLQHFVASRICKIHVNIRHADALRVQKAFKKQLVVQRINIRNSDKV